MGYPHHKKLIFKGLQYLFINRKPEKYNTITPNSGRPFFVCNMECCKGYKNESQEVLCAVIENKDSITNRVGCLPRLE